MAFMSIMFAMLAFFGIVFGFLGFLSLVGIIFLIVGIVNRQKPKYVGKKSPTACIVSGIVFLLLPVGTAIFIGISIIWSIFSGFFENFHYLCLILSTASTVFS